MSTVTAGASAPIPAIGRNTLVDMARALRVVFPLLGRPTWHVYRMVIGAT
jgi:uncharacterized membrane protein